MIIKEKNSSHFQKGTILREPFLLHFFSQCVIVIRPEPQGPAALFILFGLWSLNYELIYT